MRDRLLEDFRPNINAGYTSAELIALRVAGKPIPDRWIHRTRHDENMDAEAAAVAASIARDMEKAEKARVAELKAKDTATLPKLEKLEEEFNALKDDAAEARAAAVAAVRSYRAAHRAAAGRFGTMSRLIKDTYADPTRDSDGDAEPGQVYVHWSGVIVIKERQVEPVILDPIFDHPVFRGL